MTIETKSDNNRPTPEEATEVLAEEQAKRLEAFQAGITVLEEEHNCGHMAVAVSPGGNVVVPVAQMLPPNWSVRVISGARS